MPIITTITVALVSVGIGAATAAVLAPIIVSTVASVGLSLLADALRPEDAVAKAGAGATGLEKETSASTIFPRAWLVGRVLTAGSHVYSQVSDVKADGSLHSGQPQNRYYDTVICLADHEVSGLAALSVDDEFRTGFDTATPGKMGSVVPGFERDGDARAWIKFFVGTESQMVDERLDEASRVRGDSSVVWTNAHRLRGCAYARSTYQFDEKRTKDWPTSAYVVNGAKLYDLRKDSTNGGSGAHRYNNPATWEFSRNPAVMLGHFMRGFRFPGNRYLVGLQGVTVDMLDQQSFRQAAADCADNVNLKAGGTESRYLAGFEFPIELANADIAETLLSTMAGRLSWTGARWRLFAGVAQAPVVTITDADILISEPREFDPKAGLAELVNRVTATYTDPNEDWSVVAAHPRSSSADQLADGSRQLTLELSLDAVPSGTQAQRIMEIGRRQSREQKRHRLALLPKFLPLEAGDWIAWTSARWGYVAKTFRVDGVELDHDLTVYVHLAECSASIFDWVPATDQLDKVVRDLAPGGDPDDDVGLALTLSAWIDEAGTRKAQAGIAATWVDLENRRVEMVELEYKRNGGSRTYSERVDVDKLDWNTTKGIRWDTTYRVRGRPRFRDGSWGAWTSATLDGAPTITTPDIPVDEPELVTGDNTVFNPSFERFQSAAENDTEAAGWTQGGDTGFLRTSGNAEHGAWAMRHSGAGTVFIEPTVAQRTQTRVGQRFSATVQMKITAGATFTNAGLRIVFRDVSGSILQLNSDSVSSLTGSYVQLTVLQAMAPAGTFTVNVRLFVDGQSASGSVWWDSVSLRRNSKTRDLEDKAVATAKLDDFAVDRGQMKADINLPVLAKVEDAVGGLFQLYDPHKVINADSLKRLWSRQVRLSNDDTESDTLNTLLVGNLNARRLKRAKVRIDDESGAVITLDSFFDSVGRGDGVRMKPASIGYTPMADRSTVNMDGDHAGGSVDVVNTTFNLLYEITLDVRRGTSVLIEAGTYARLQTGLSDKRAFLDLDLWRGEYGVGERLRGMDFMEVSTYPKYYSLPYVDNNPLSGGDHETVGSVNYRLYARKTPSASHDGDVRTQGRFISAINFRQVPG